MLFLLFSACSTEKLTSVDVCHAYRSGYESYPEGDLPRLFENERYIQSGISDCYEQTVFTENQCSNLQEFEAFECPGEADLFVMSRTEAYFQGYVRACKKTNNVLEDIDQTVIAQPISGCGLAYSIGSNLSYDSYDFTPIDCDKLELKESEDSTKYSPEYKIVLEDKTLRTIDTLRTPREDETSIEIIEEEMKYFAEDSKKFKLVLRDVAKVSNAEMDSSDLGIWL